MKNSTRSKRTGTLKVNKSSITGRFVTEAYAKHYPKTTFKGTIKAARPK
jgi:hypothetical protein